ncbi:MAG: hypothetical protein N4J56_007956 [Chroococcidiopsis sp. SAG 2025]|uniref:DUF6887 family protein n=1 Tax=Chroococcidiopsis sp. SAG 2025 TaxID=171389 RepID=UPI00293740B8|nr:hypothetical protein [Chroococcidiopsis sp. SAG 2025]MDV2998251.1 hypothetical protein [Chroococcidiopsis sp. SAG 2025]
MKPNFQTMSKEELRTYVLNHRDDEAAFHTYMDKLHAQENRIEHPAVDSFDELENYPEFARKLQRESGKHG